MVALLAAIGAWFVAGDRRQKVVGKFTSIATRTLQPKNYDDATLKDKVESELFRDEHEVKGSISINAQEGVVQLRGEVPSQDLIDALVDRTRRSMACARSRACCTPRAQRPPCTTSFGCERVGAAKRPPLGIFAR